MCDLNAIVFHCVVSRKMKKTSRHDMKRERARENTKTSKDKLTLVVVIVVVVVVVFVVTLFEYIFI